MSDYAVLTALQKCGSCKVRRGGQRAASRVAASPGGVQLNEERSADLRNENRWRMCGPLAVRARHAFAHCWCGPSLDERDDGAAEPAARQPCAEHAALR